MNSKIHVICFADSRLKKSVNRLKSEIEDFTIIDTAYFFGEQDLDSSFKKEFYPIRHRRGYGYWKWKSYFVKKIMDEINSDDILIWSDVGNIFNSRGEHRLMEYIEMSHANRTGIIAFSQNGNTERLWTKGDLFNHFKVYDDPHFTDTDQIWAGAFILSPPRLY